jgi:hypothetical protein
MYLYEVLQQSAKRNVTVRVCMRSGDVHEGKAVVPSLNVGMIEVNLIKGGTVHIIMNFIESITVIDNLQMLERLDENASK